MLIPISRTSGKHLMQSLCVSCKSQMEMYGVFCFHPSRYFKKTATYPNNFWSKQPVRCGRQQMWDSQCLMRTDNPALPHNERIEMYHLLQCWWIFHSNHNLLWILILTVECLCLRGTSCNHVHLFGLGTSQLDRLCKKGCRARQHTGQMDKAHKPPKLPKLVRIQAHILCKWMWPLPTLRKMEVLVAKTLTWHTQACPSSIQKSLSLMML